MNEMSAISGRAATGEPSPATVFEAIVKRQALAATYNRGEIMIAPHVIYARHDELYVDAITIARDGKPPREEKIGTFKLSGLGALRMTPRRFEPSALFVRGDAKYADSALLSIEP